MKEPIDYCSYRQKIKNSLFLAECFPVETADNVRLLLKVQKQKYSDATHVVHCYALGKRQEILGASDDGEPSGTAGGPCLNVIKAQGITNCLVTVTRWFGGTLLGTGGLAKAYGSSTAQLMKKAAAESKLVEIIETAAICFNVTYGSYSKIEKYFEQYCFIPSETVFTENVKISGTMPEEKLQSFLAFLTDATNGEIRQLMTEGTC